MCLCQMQLVPLHHGRGLPLTSAPDNIRDRVNAATSATGKRAEGLEHVDAFRDEPVVGL
jgi:hypothetical protein